MPTAASTFHANPTLWVRRSLAGRLSPGEQQALSRHLAECSVCVAAVSDEAFLDRVLCVLDEHEMPGAGFEARVTARFAEAVQRQSGWLAVLSGKRWRLGWKLAAACGGLLLLMARLGGLDASPGASRWDQARAAVVQLLFQRPRYEELLRAGVSEQPDRLLAAFHRLTTCYVGMLLWLTVAVLLAVALLEWCRSRFRPMKA